MKNNLVKSVSQLFFGSAIAGIGLSFGRDIYKSFKKNLILIVFLIIFLGGLILPFISGMKAFNWQPINLFKSFFLIKIPWTFISLVGLIILSFYFNLLIDLIYSTNQYTISWFFPISKEALSLSFLLWGAGYLLGGLFALFKRKKQKTVYQVEKHNEDFLENIGLEEIDGGNEFTHIDQDGNLLRLLSIGLDVIVFKAVGKRNKKAFILLDNEGRFIEYSGIILN